MPEVSLLQLDAGGIVALTRTVFRHKEKRLKTIQEHLIDKIVVGKAEVDKPGTNLTVLYIILFDA